MKDTGNQYPEIIWKLLEALCEERITAAQAQRLEKLVLGNSAVRRLYLDYVNLHGSLHWDAATPPFELPLEKSSSAVSDDDSATINAKSRFGSLVGRRWAFRSVLAASACLLFVLGVLVQRSILKDDSTAGNGGTVMVQGNPDSFDQSRTGGIGSQWVQ